MPDVTTLVIAGGAWALLLVLVWAMCAAAARGDGQDDRAEASVPQPSTVVADTGAIREHLHESMRLVGAEQLTVTVGIDGRDAILASAPGVVEARPGDRPQLAVPVRLGGRNVAMLRATRRPGAPRFDAADMLVMQGIAARVAGAMQTAHSSAAVPLDEPSAMA
jgi:GAF domain-containing protein